MKRSAGLLVTLAVGSFAAGWLVETRMLERYQTNPESGVSDPPQTEWPRLTAILEDQRDRQHPPPLLEDEVLGKIEFEKISGGAVTPVAQHLFQLTDKQCLSIKELLEWREQERIALRHRQEQQAVLTKTDPEMQQRFGDHPVLTWEIPVAENSDTREEFYDRATEIVGAETADHLFGKRRPLIMVAMEKHHTPRAGVEHHQQIVAVKGDENWVTRMEFLTLRWKRSNTQQTRIPITDLSAELRTVIERELAMLGE